ncbi:uncharacterized protein EI97DRAFT_290770 [Westerdykella ornata]|uniref:Uncharacterized protein n=1 Tax=Westerdykella ornata TaxID=318751 RepID=A0A6A6JMR5_WESOR|nr:uncharacterized protein EI97DRAFT_290770 [Westerdykella ornata]KAF2277413.1 hypothetical protein EI97DRAFT_290770 [Westerdykella ornata]
MAPPEIQVMEGPVTPLEDMQQHPNGYSKPLRKFVPELVETTTRSTRRAPPPPPIDTSLVPGKKVTTVVEEAGDSSVEPSRTHRRRRSQEKFAQEWEQWGSKAQEEFSKHKQDAASKSETRRSRDTVPRCRRASFPRTPPPPPENTPAVDLPQNPLFLEIQRATSTSPVSRRRPSWASMRSSHSFRVPDLDPIESSESEPGSPLSFSTSHSAVSKHSHHFREVSTNNSPDDRDPGPLLELAAKAAEQQLREQAMAAFINQDEHEHVDHFIDREVDTPPVSEKPRRESFCPENNWDLLEMRRYREEVERQKEAKREEKRRLQAKLNKLDFKKTDCWDQAMSWLKTPVAHLVITPLDDVMLDPMQRCARPPMLGTDIEFPRCSSPETARFDTTQGCDAVRIATDYLAEQSLQAEKGEGLWCGQNMATDRPSFYSRVNSAANSRSPSPSAGGLWAGLCARTGRTPPRGPTGILTPRMGTNVPSPSPTPSSHLMPPTPPPTRADFACIDQKLATEAAIDKDYGDEFVTQVYNYLSLGYPSIGRMFDEELSRISRIPVSELRQDDHLPSARGYIRLGEDACADSNIKEETCMRWRALRMYIREWARQHPNMASERSASHTAERRGSWAN